MNNVNLDSEQVRSDFTNSFNSEKRDYRRRVNEVKEKLRNIGFIERRQV